MILHTVNKSPFGNHCLQDCLNVCTDNDTVLLLEDGVYGINFPALSNSPFRVYALQADIAARGLTDSIPETVTVIDDATFVTLCTEYSKVVSWY